MSTCSRASWDTWLSFRNARTGALTCLDDSCTQQSTLTGTLTAGAGLYAFYVDGYNSTAFGTYSIQYTIP